LRGQRKISYETHHAVYGAALAARHRKLAMAFVIAAQTQALCIVNTRRHARELYAELTRQAPDKSSVFHLSSQMCVQHRFDILETEIRVRLREQHRCWPIGATVLLVRPFDEEGGGLRFFGRGLIV
jgi:hypothetical protein